MPYDVFVSCPYSDGPAARPIIQALDAVGLAVGHEERGGDDFQSMRRAIGQGVARSKTLLVYYSHGYARSRTCQWQLTAGLLAAERDGDAPRRVLVVNPEPDDLHIYPTELRDALIQTTAAGGREVAVRVAECVEQRVSELSGYLGDLADLTFRDWYGARGDGSQRFVGRLAELWHLHAALQTYGVAIIAGDPGRGMMGARGVGGVGKSQLAREYALRFSAAHPGGVFWLRAYGCDDVDGMLSQEGREAERTFQEFQFAMGLGLPVQGLSPSEVGRALAVALEAQGKPFLWVLDDLPPDIDKEALARWLAPQPFGKTLVTTSRSNDPGVAGLLTLEALDAEAAYQLLETHREPAGRDEELAARGLADDLGGHALALDVAGAWVAGSTKPRPFATCRETLQDCTADEREVAADVVGSVPRDGEQETVTTLVRSFEILGEEGWDLLRLASALAPAPIPVDLVAAAFARVDQLQDPDARRRAEMALEQVCGLALAEDSQTGAGHCSVHPLIALTARSCDARADRRMVLRSAILDALNEAMALGTDIRTHHEIWSLVAHARWLTGRAGSLPEADLLERLAGYDYLRGDYEAAEREWQQEHDLRRREQYPDAAISAWSRFDALLALGEEEGARMVLERDLLWLLDREPETLTGPQRQIRQCLESLEEGWPKRRKTKLGLP